MTEYERKVSISSTRVKKTIMSKATNWEELQLELDIQEVGYDNMKAILGKSLVTLDHPKAILPEGEFVLHLMPQKTKAGIDVDNMSYGELRAAIKAACETNTGKDFFNVGKNYTNKSTDQLKYLLKSWNSLTIKPIVVPSTNVAISEDEEAPELTELVDKSTVNKLREFHGKLTDISTGLQEIRRENDEVSSELADAIASIDEAWDYISQAIDELTQDESTVDTNQQEIDEEYEMIRIGIRL